MRRLLAAGALILGLVPLRLVAGDQEEIVVADTIAWGALPAYFVDAPKNLRKKMARAVEVAVQSGPLQVCAQQERCSWLVQETVDLRFFRAVSGRGKALLSGSVCRGGFGFPRQAYYPERLLQFGNCVELQWDAENGKYIFNVPAA
jgi:hypothetical protein